MQDQTNKLYPGLQKNFKNSDNNIVGTVQLGGATGSGATISSHGFWIWTSNHSPGTYNLRDYNIGGYNPEPRIVDLDKNSFVLRLQWEWLQSRKLQSRDTDLGFRQPFICRQGYTLGGNILGGYSLEPRILDLGKRSLTIWGATISGATSSPHHGF